MENKKTSRGRRVKIALRGGEPGRPECLGGVDKKLADKEERARQRRLEEEKMIVKNRDLISTTISILECKEDSDGEQILNSELSLPELSCFEKASKRDRKNLVRPKLVTALYRCQLGMREPVYILHAVIEALCINRNDFFIDKSSIQRIRTQVRKTRTETMKTDFQNNLPDLITVHWDGKLLPRLDV
ncbi:hypothetical protein EVAR_16334_1 [Eumeta japonica]|uniref:Uncharacterized protein n=1 Tax=Eumeta variegata TaxID=151549 RepID=A0A4C1VFL6_EUMVA|nr:hypothetical protein EVAR_16334_1 [Eumeta japonica]